MLPDETAGIGNVIKPSVIHEEGSHLWTIQLGRSFVFEIEDMGELDQFLNELRGSLTKQDAFDYRIMSDANGIMVYSRQLSSRYKQDSALTYLIIAHINVAGRNYLIKNQDQGNSKKEILFMQKSLESIEIKTTL